MKSSESKASNINQFFLNNWPWWIDVVISLLSLSAFIYALYLAIFDRESFSFLDSIISIFPFIYSTNNAIKKIITGEKERNNFRKKLDIFFQDSQEIIKYHFSNDSPKIDLVEKRVIDSHIDEWRKFKNISSFEYQLISTYINNLHLAFPIKEEDRLLIKYILITSNHPMCFPQYILEMKNADYYSDSSPHNSFIKKLHEFSKNQSPLQSLTTPDLDPATIEETVNFAFKSNFNEIKNLLNEKEKKEKVDFLLGKCFENAYTNIGNLQLKVHDDSARKLFLLFKYDERFSIKKRIWRTQIRNHFSRKYAKDSTIEKHTEESIKKLDSIIYPLPFSHAISDYPHSIERIAPRDKFVYIIYPERFVGKEQGWTAEKFITERVIPNSQEYLKDLNKRIVQAFPFLKGYEKKELDTNYYLFEFSRDKFSYHATSDAIPTTIKRFLINNILDSDDAGNIVASQIVYLKQVINNLSISGLLFTEDHNTQEEIRKIENSLINNLSANDIPARNIYDLINLGNQYEQFENHLHLLVHETELKRRYGNKYERTKYLASKIISNAREILSVFTSLEAK